MGFKMYRNKLGQYVVLDGDKVIIITHHRQHAIAYARSLEDGTHGT